VYRQRADHSPAVRSRVSDFSKKDRQQPRQEVGGGLSLAPRLVVVTSHVYRVDSLANRRVGPGKLRRISRGLAGMVSRLLECRPRMGSGSSRSRGYELRSLRGSNLFRLTLSEVYMREEDKLPSTALLTIAEAEKELLNALAALIPAISHVNCWARSGFICRARPLLRA